MPGGSPLFDGWAALLLAAAYAHVLAAPFTKVEESFNLQAVHDLCHHGIHIPAYDHQAFPGVVPRTFLGALALAGPACPIARALQAAGASKLAGLYATRLTLATFSALGLLRLRHAVGRVFGGPVSNAFVLLACVQFHLLYYAGRPLPNSLALPLVACAAADWLLLKPARVVCLLAFASLVVRCDLLPFSAIVGLALLARGSISFRKAALTGAAAAAASLAATVAVDSLFWGRLLWPEGSVLWFNTAENRSAEWGTQPWHYYATSALPRALLAGLPLAACGLLSERRCRLPTAAVLAHVALYSLLPHKELRFLLPVLPLLNLPAACALARAWRGAPKSAARRLLLAAAGAGLAASLALTCLSVAASRWNYPGGHALLRLHELAAAVAEPRVHVDVLPAMTGVSRFGERGPPWQYSKEEGLGPAELQARGFTHLLSASPQVPGFEVLEAVPVFARLRLRRGAAELLACLRGGAWPVQLVLEDQVFIHGRQSPV